MSNGDGTFTPHEFVIADGTQVYEHPTLTGDVNGDGKTDLMFVYHDAVRGSVVRTKMSNGDGTFTPHEFVIADGNQVYAYPILTGDINGDGKTDLIFNGQGWQGCGLNIRVKLSAGDGTWCPGWQLLGDGSGVHQYTTMTGYINDDKKTDLIFTFNDISKGLIIRSKISNGFSCQQVESTSSSTPSSYILIFPNPTNNYIQFKTDTIATWNIRIINLMGRVLQSYEKVNNSIMLDLSSLANGLYIVDILDINTGKRTMGKVIKISH